jgi:OmpA-OmpF porin, OOP family
MVKRTAFYLPSLRKAALSAPIAFIAAGLLSLLTAYGAVLLIERLSAQGVKSMLLTEGITWADVTTDGLQVHLIGIAPNEAARYRVVNLVGAQVDSARIRDDLEVTAVKAVEAPRFSLEILRNDDGIQIIGLLPNIESENALISTAQKLANEAPFTEMIETAAYPPSPEWEAALAFGVKAFEMLPRSKISISADRVTITAIATSISEKRLFDTELGRAKPQGVRTQIDVSAPRPVITPFTLRFVKDAAGQRFDACAADTDLARSLILSAAAKAGATGADCTIGLGVPSPSWSTAAVAGIAAVADLSSATLTFRDADVTLQAGSDVSQSDFDRIVGDLEAALPQLFSLNATLEPPPEGRSAGPSEFRAVLNQETGRIEMRGRVTDDLLRIAVDNFAKAEFGSNNVYQATVLDANLPDGWPLRVLAGLQALAELEGGSMTARADIVEVTGVTGSTAARARISQILSDKLGQGQAFRVDVTYDRMLDPIASLPTPQECVDRVTKVLATNKIIFPPASSDIDKAADRLMDSLAEALKDCSAIKIEIGGHTDGQGSDEGNLALSQARAEAVLVALQVRRVDVSGFVAKGYGETVPLGDNATEDGREANRRIEFKLIADPSPLPSPVAAQSDASANSAAVDDGSPSAAPATMTLKPKARPARSQ